MPWTYDPSQLPTSTLYQVRAEIQDTNINNQMLLDEEINYAISSERNMWSAAARCCEMIARRLLMKADPKLGRAMQVVYSKAAMQYFGMARMLRSKAMGTVAPYVGGMTVNDKETIGEDSSLVAPMFSKTMMENPWAGGYTSDSSDPISSAESDTDASTDFV
jgi:hypothetical protein